MFKLISTLHACQFVHSPEYSHKVVVVERRVGELNK
jgi:hypothetical protein